MIVAPISNLHGALVVKVHTFPLQVCAGQIKSRWGTRASYRACLAALQGGNKETESGKLIVQIQHMLFHVRWTTIPSPAEHTKHAVPALQQGIRSHKNTGEMENNHAELTLHLRFCTPCGAAIYGTSQILFLRCTWRLFDYVRTAGELLLAVQ